MLVDLLTSPGLSDVRILAGPDDAVPVTGVRLLARADGLPAVPAGTVAIVLAPLPGHLLDVAVRDAAAARAAAVVLTGPEWAAPDGRGTPVPATVRALAERGRVAVLHTDGDLAALVLAVDRAAAGNAEDALARVDTAARDLPAAAGDADRIAVLAGRVLGTRVERRAAGPGEDGAAAAGAEGDVRFAAPARTGHAGTAVRAVLAMAALAAAGSTYADVPARSRGPLLAELLTAPRDRAAHLAARGRSLGLPVDGWHVVLRLAPAALDGTARYAALESVASEALRLLRGTEGERGTGGGMAAGFGTRGSAGGSGAARFGRSGADSSGFAGGGSGAAGPTAGASEAAGGSRAAGFGRSGADGPGPGAAGSQAGGSGSERSGFAAAGPDTAGATGPASRVAGSAPAASSPAGSSPADPGPQRAAVAWNAALVDDALVLLGTFPAEPTTHERRVLLAAARRAVDRLRHLRPDADLRCGVGAPHRGPLGIRSSAREARAALAQAADNPVVAHDAAGLDRMLLEWYTSEAAREAVGELLAPVLALGPDRAEPLLRTAQAYLDHNNSPARAADVLHLHRNAVGSRIRRFVDLTGADLNDPEQRIALQLACRAGLSALRSAGVASRAGRPGDGGETVWGDTAVDG